MDDIQEIGKSDNQIPEQKRRRGAPEQFLFKPGQSGNPAGRPKGKSMKEYTREYLQHMTEEERIKFLNSIDPEKTWRMAEGNPPQPVELGGNIDMPFVVKLIRDARGSSETKGI